MGQRKRAEAAISQDRPAHDKNRRPVYMAQEDRASRDSEISANKLRGRLDYRYREIVEESDIDPDVALERDYYLEKTKVGLERIGFKRTQARVPAIVIPRFAPSGEEIPP